MGNTSAATRTRALGVALLALLALLCLLAIARSAVGTRLDSFTIDEPWHIVAGASYVRSGDFRLSCMDIYKEKLVASDLITGKQGGKMMACAAKILK